MTQSEDMMRISAQIDIPAAAIQAVVENAKKMAGKNANGVYHLDTHQKLCEMISAFLKENDFLAYARDIDNYR